jgi:F420H(2)-dependent quinone reductase
MAFPDFKNALNDTNEIELTTTGRISGRQSSRPLWFVTQGESLYLLPVTGSDSQWYKNVLKTPTVRLAAAGTQYRAGPCRSATPPRWMRWWRASGPNTVRATSRRTTRSVTLPSKSLRPDSQLGPGA